MLFSVARLRLVTFFLFTSRVGGKLESLFTSSVTYCAPPESLFIQRFDVAYIAQNSSVSFNISAASVEPNINVTANLFLNVYGMHPFNVTINLCSILGGALCPLPMYNFTGTDSITLPFSLGITHKIPAIAYKIPDLEAFAQLTLIEVGTNNVKACIQSTLSNGWTTHQTAVEWTTGGLSLLALLSSMWHSLSPDSLVPSRLPDLLHLYQSIAITGLLKLNYPSIYREFTLNFAWSIGLLFTSSTSTVQNAINDIRHHTGGGMAGAAGSAVELVNRKLSPYNVPAGDFVFSQGLARLFHSPFLTMLATINMTSTLLDGTTEAGNVATVTSANVLDAGVPIYVNSIHIATANAFMTVFISALILVAIALALFVLGYTMLHALDRLGWRNDKQWVEVKYTYPSFVKAWGLRLCMIIFTPFMIFTIYQWSLRDSWLTTLLSVMSFLLIFACIFYPTCLTLHLALRNTPYALYTHGEHLNSLGPLFSRYRTPRYYFFTCILVGSLLKAILVASLKEHGQAQVALMLLAELGILLSHVILRPFKSRGSDILAIFIAMIRFVAAGLLVAFVEGLSLAAIPRVVVGVVIAILYSIAVIVMLLDYLIQAVREVWSSSIRRTHSHQEAADKSVPDKGSPLAFGLAPGLSSCGAPSQSSEQNATMSTQLSSSSEPPPNEVFTLSQVTTDR